MRGIALWLAVGGCVAKTADGVDTSWTDTEADSDTDADSDADPDADTDADTDSEPEVPCGEDVDEAAVADCAAGGYAAITGGTGHDTVQAAIDAAGTGDLVTVCPGIWAERLSLGRDQTLVGADPSAGAVVIDAEQRVGIEIGAQGATVRGLSIRDGQAVVGGGILAYGALVVDCVVIHHCDATYGGGIYATLGLTVTDSELRDNVGEYGGAVWASGGPLLIEDSTFLRNSGDYGGAVYAGTATTVVRSVFDENDGDYGSAVRMSVGYAGPVAVTVEDSSFTGNVSDWTAAIDMSGDDGSTLEVSRTTFTSNTSWDAAGAVDASVYGSVVLGFTDVTFDGNTGLGAGAVTFQTQGAASVTFDDTTFADNVGTTGGGAFAAIPGHGPVSIVANGLTVLRNSGGEGGIWLRGADGFACTGCDFGAEGSPDDNLPVDLTTDGVHTDDLPSTF